eukprot:scaffold80999_cov63-Phaeocystis_antarctica.AAC.1
MVSAWRPHGTCTVSAGCMHDAWCMHGILYASRGDARGVGGPPPAARRAAQVAARRRVPRRGHGQRRRTGIAAVHGRPGARRALEGLVEPAVGVATPLRGRGWGLGSHE